MDKVKMKKVLIALGFLLLLIPLMVLAQGLSPTDELHLTRGVAATATPTFNPSDIAGLHDWYDFSDTTTLFTGSDCATGPVALNGDLIGCVTNKVAGGVSLTQGVPANKFTWTLPGWNALGVGTADGINDFLQTADFAAALSQPTTIFLVVRHTGTFANHRVAYDGIAINARQYLSQKKTTGIFYLYAGDALDSTDSTTGTPLILTAVFNGASSALYKNGGVIASGNAGTDSMTGLTLGNVYNGIAYPFQGNYGEFLIYNPSPTPANQALIEGYLWAKWGFPYAQSLPRDQYFVQAHRLALWGWLSPMNFGSVAHAQEMKQTEWKHREVIVVPATQLANASAAAKAWDPDVGGEYTFSVPLSADGGKTITHWGTETALTDKMLAKVSTASVKSVNQMLRFNRPQVTFSKVLETTKLKLMAGE